MENCIVISDYYKQRHHSLYSYREEIKFQQDGQSQLQQEDSCYDQKPPLPRVQDVGTEIDSNEGSRHKPSDTSNNPSEYFYWHNGQKLYRKSRRKMLVLSRINAPHFN
jgi:hypothetical protein